MKVSELMDILGEMDQELYLWIWIDGNLGGGFEAMTKDDVAVRNGRVEIG